MIPQSLKEAIDEIPINQNTDNKPVIVYDIDGTLIDFNGNPIWPIINSYHYARQKGLTPIIITARPGFPENIERTKQSLQQFGITGYMGMYFMPVGLSDQAYYKLQSRKNIHDRGMQVVISIGDMPFDIGEYGGHGFIVSTRPQP